MLHQQTLLDTTAATSSQVFGVWDYALNRAGWGEREVWTGSCPCQPFSVAGKGDGFNDERHLWPAFHWLIEQRRPIAVFGEQVASKDGYAWLDLVQADLEGTGYTVGAVVAPAAGFGAPHQRHRMYWVADTESAGLQVRDQKDGRVYRQRPDESCVIGDLGDPDDAGPQGRGFRRDGADQRVIGAPGVAGGLADTADFRQHGRGPSKTGNGGTPRVEPERFCDASFWSAADWIYCRDEKWRPVEPGTFPLVDGAPSRVGRLRAYGNAICAPQAEEFIKAFLEVRP